MGFIERRTFLRFEPALRSASIRSGPVLERRHGITVRYAPIHFVNTTARVLIVGITPGEAQARIMLQECAAGFKEGLSRIDACCRAKYEASFAGPMRHNLVRTLNELDLNRVLGIKTCDDLFGSAQSLLDTASVLPYPVFVDGRNYTGHNPRLNVNSWLWKYTRIFARQLRMLDRPLIVPLGKTASAVVRAAAPEDARCLWNFPHPSGANGHAKAQFQKFRVEMAREVRSLSGAGRG